MEKNKYSRFHLTPIVMESKQDLSFPYIDNTMYQKSALILFQRRVVSSWDILNPYAMTEPHTSRCLYLWESAGIQSLYLL